MDEANNSNIFFEANPNAMWVYEPGTLQIKAVNKAAVILYGYSRQEMLSLTIADLRPQSEVPELEKEVDKRKQVFNNSGTWQHKKKNGEAFYVRILSYPITWEDKSCKLVVAQDISEQKYAEEGLKAARSELEELYEKEKRERLQIQYVNNRLKLLKKVGDIFAEENADHITALKRVAKLLVSEVADICSFDILENDSLERVAQEVILSDKEKIAAEIRNKYPEWFYNLDLLKEVINSGEPILEQKFLESDFKNQITEEELYDLIQQLGIQSYFILPLKAGGKVLGTVTLIILQSRRRFKEDDLSFLTELAAKTGMHIENSRISEELMSFNEQLELKVKERTHQLKNTNEELESFSYSVSHDLRTPLRAIAGYTSLLREDYLDKLDDDGQKFLTIIDDETRRMGELIDDLLAFSRLSRKEKVGQNFSMNKLVRQCIEEVLQAHSGPAPELEVKELPNVSGDPKLLQRVWINLIGNAIKYQPEGQKPNVVIGSESHEKDQIVFYIKDNGVGFKMKYADKLFGVFQRLHSDEEFEGTGIGLALVRRIVNRHGGDVWADSEIGKGSTFYFSLPNSES